ncbi:MAG TPA: DUF302 domain-containing protein [bacterium]|mgnify:CR=1 FL=1|nr:DUF302 domain-containing protein [bacterium]
MNFAKRVDTSLDFDTAVEKLTAALATEGFGILTRIDVQETMKKKLDHTMDRYVILGACNPPLARKLLTANKDIGVMLPCNISVFEEKGGTAIVARSAEPFVEMVDDPILQEVFQDVGARIDRVLATITG